MNLKDITVGSVATVDARLVYSSICENKAKNGSTYVTLSLKDSESTIKCSMFNTDKGSLGYTEDAVVRATVKCDLYLGKPSYIIDTLEPSDAPLTDFIQLPPFDIGAMYDEIKSIVSRYADNSEVLVDGQPMQYVSLADATLAVLEHSYISAGFQHSSAALSMHHSYKGGLLHHTYCMTKVADAICSSGAYSDIDAELVICGVVLHDIGKIREYDTSALGDTALTLKGMLGTHLVDGANMLGGFLKNVNPLKKAALIHIIQSHHGKLEYGAVVEPVLPEASLVHEIDMLDSRQEMFREAYFEIEDNAQAEKKHFGLEVKPVKLNYHNYTKAFAEQYMK